MQAKRIVIGGLIAAGVLALCVLNPMVFPVILGLRQIQKMEAALQRPQVYEPVGSLLALYCQSDNALFPAYLGPAWLPEELNAVGEGWASIWTNGAHVELGGGFHHFGYSLVLDAAASTAPTRVWQLYMYSEDSKEIHLQTLKLPAGAQLTPDAILDKVVAGFDAQLRKQRDNLRAHEGKIQTYLRFNKVPAARQACADLLTAMPDNWWAVLVNALLMEEQSAGRGAEFIASWAKQHEDFDRCMDLAYFDHLTQRPREAAQAILRATNFSASTWGLGRTSEYDGNAEFRGYTAAMCAYRTGDYDAVITLCNHLLPVTLNGDYAKAGLKTLKAAAQQAKAGQVREVAWDSNILPFDAFAKTDIAKLLGRAVPRPTRQDLRD